jgi:hypothetical protein
VIFGGGYAVNVLERLDWLVSLDLAYWGDLDTHGFAILNRLRRRFPHARSIRLGLRTGDVGRHLAHEFLKVA